MIFEATNNLLCFVLAVHVRRDQLEFCQPGLGNDPFEVCAGFVISDVEVHREPLCSQASHDGIEGGYMMFIRLRWEGLLQNQVPLYVISDHDILIARACANKEPPSIIQVQLVERVDLDKDFLHVVIWWW